ncbi:MAG: DUF1622 domain-containing protein [Erysipelotrichaceae bacterium]|nr:DUF1622 domain-containing protein [Erysipelotrichaceae bacterium]
MHELFIELIELIVTLAELTAVVIVLIALFQAIYRLIKVHKFNFKKAHHDTTLPSGLSYALSVLIIAEIMETLLGSDFVHLGKIAATAGVRFIFVLIIIFENKEAEKHEVGELKD